MKRYVYKSLQTLILASICWSVVRFDPAGQIFNIPGILIVIAGTFVATALGQSFRTVVNVIRQLPQKLARQSFANEADIGLLLKVAELHRQGNIRLAEQAARRIDSPFLRSSVQLVLDRTPYADLNRMLQWKIGAQREQDHSEIQIFRTMMAFAPAFGMLGTLFGLISMLYGLDSKNFQHIGESMGFAMLTTVYGLMLANLALKPIVTRLEMRSKERLAWLYVQCEAVFMVHGKYHPNLIGEYLRAFLDNPGESEPEAELQLGTVKSVS